MRLRIEDHVIDKIIYQIENSRDKTCGFLFGIDGELRIIQKFMPVKNNAVNSKTDYQISPADYLHAELHAAKNNMQLLGVLQSRFSLDTKPSENDVNNALPYFSYVIVSTIGNKLADIESWQLNDFNLFEKENIKLAYEQAM